MTQCIYDLLLFLIQFLPPEKDLKFIFGILYNFTCIIVDDCVENQLRKYLIYYIVKRFKRDHTAYLCIMVFAISMGVILILKLFLSVVLNSTTLLKFCKQQS